MIGADGSLASTLQSTRLPARVLVIGLGSAGARFLQALDYLASPDGDRVRLVGICDDNPARLNAVETTTARFADATEAIRSVRPSVVCVCVNERAHHRILRTIRAVGPSVELVLCEKPLTETLDQFSEIEQLYDPDSITVNFVERHSPIVDDFIEWRNRKAAELFRAEFHWGKYRFRDERPTMGVLSEITHPIDLLRLLADLPDDTEFDLHNAFITESDFSAHRGRVADSVDTLFTLGSGLLVNGHASFLWEGRRRSVVLFCQGESDASLYQAVLRFDDPLWDQDRLTIFRLDAINGNRSLEVEFNYTNSDFPAELSQVVKVTKFVDGSLRRLVDRRHDSTVVTLPGAKWVQTAIATIAHHATVVRPSNFDRHEEGSQ